MCSLKFLIVSTSGDAAFSTSSSGIPAGLALPKRPYALFHYLSQGTATLSLEQGEDLHMSAGDFVVITSGEQHLLYSDRRTKPFPLMDPRTTARTSRLRATSAAVRNRRRR